MTLSSKVRKHTTAMPDLGIIEFAEHKHGLNIQLFPAQRFLLKVLEKLPLDDTVKDIELRDKFNKTVLKTFTEQGYYDHLIGDGRFSLVYEDYLLQDTTQIMFAMGRRATKSTTISIWIAFKLYRLLLIEHPQGYFGILDDDSMNITMTALGQDNADKLFSKFYSIMKASAFFKAHMLETATGNSLKVWTKRDIATLKDKKPGAHTNSINIVALPNSPGVRGDNNIFVVGDEFAHFNNSAKSTRNKPLDEAIYEALTPSVSGFQTPEGKPYGCVLLFSSPNGKQGKFFTEYDLAFELGMDSGTLAINAPTWEINPKVHPAYLKQKWAKDPSSYDQEYGAKFSANGSVWLTDLEQFNRAFDTTLINSHMRQGKLELLYFMGIDFALSNDGTAIAISHMEKKYVEELQGLCREFFSYSEKAGPMFYEEGFKIISEKIVVDYAEVRYAGLPPYEETEVLLMDDILDWIEGLYKRWPIQYGFYDQWSGEVISQMIQTRGIPRLEMVNHTQAVNDSQYKLFSQVLHQNQLKMPYDTNIINELSGLRKESKGKGFIKVEAPADGTSHDDLFDALIRSIFACWHYNKQDKAITSTLSNLFTRASLVKRAGKGAHKAQQRRSAMSGGKSNMKASRNLRSGSRAMR